MSELALVNPRPDSKRDLRTLVPGIGTGGILIAAALLAFATVGGLVAFNGMPGGSDAAGSGKVTIESSAPESAAFTAAAAAGAPAPAPAPVAPELVAATPSVAAGPTAGPIGAPPAVEVPNGEVEPPPPPSDPDGQGIGPGLPPVSSPPPPAPAPAPVVPQVPSTSGGGDVAAIVGGVDETVKGVTGIDPGLGPDTAPITKPIDDVSGGVTGGQGLGLDGVQPPDVTSELPLPLGG